MKILIVIVLLFFSCGLSAPKIRTYSKHTNNTQKIIESFNNIPVIRNLETSKIIAKNIASNNSHTVTSYTGSIVAQVLVGNNMKSESIYIKNRENDEVNKAFVKLINTLLFTPILQNKKYSTVIRIDVSHGQVLGKIEVVNDPKSREKIITSLLEKTDKTITSFPKLKDKAWLLKKKIYVTPDSILEGTVILKLKLDSMGEVIQQSILYSDNHRLNEESLRFTSRYSYEPAKRNGKNVDCWINVSVNYYNSKLPPFLYNKTRYLYKRYN